jgi:hypothetical protein
MLAMREAAINRTWSKVLVVHFVPWYSSFSDELSQ